jgi:SHS2 domain-containing protein
VTSNPNFEEVEHTADWALRVRGRDWPEFLINAALGMTSLIVADPASIPLEVERQLELAAFDAESLLVNWLSELAYWAEMERLVFREFKLDQVDSIQLRASVRGGYVPDLQKHIKAVTFHNLNIVQTAEGLVATIVFDV